MNMSGRLMDFVWQLMNIMCRLEDFIRQLENVMPHLEDIAARLDKMILRVKWVRFEQEIFDKNKA